MKLEQTFTVQAAPEVVWEALIDVARVAPCLPGASIHGQDQDGAYKGDFKVKLGPTTAAYNGVLRMTDVDGGAKVATMDARGTDKRGQGGATASIVSSVHAGDAEGQTRVDIVTDFAITGRLARFGRGGMVQDVANRLLREFARNLEALLQAEGAAGSSAGAPEDSGAAADADAGGIAAADADAGAVGAGAVGAGAVGAGAGGTVAGGTGADTPAGAVAAAADADAAPGLGTAGTATGSAPQPPHASGAPPRASTAPRSASAAPPAAEPVSGTAILLGALADRARREPGQAAGAVAVLALLLVWLSRRGR